MPKFVAQMGNGAEFHVEAEDEATARRIALEHGTVLSLKSSGKSDNKAEAPKPAPKPATKK
jgi:hypothetical protein